MTKIEELKQIYANSLLSELLLFRKADVYENFSSLRFKSNRYRIRSLELWDHSDGVFLKIYHAPDISQEVKEAINLIPGKVRSVQNSSDFRGNFNKIASKLRETLLSEAVATAASSNPIVSRSSGYEGLELPDVDTSEELVLGRVFDWKEILAIQQDESIENQLKKELSKPGVYLQRSTDGKARYVGSAYGERGIIGRWMMHLGSNGNAKHLNFYILENGYSNIAFTVLEFAENEECARKAEKRWKLTLGTNSGGSYDGFRLNCN